MMLWWGWMIFGAALLAVELLVLDAQFYLVFLGLSAALVGLTGMFGVVMPEWMQWLMFAVVSLIFFFTFRRTLYEKLRSGARGFQNTISGGSVTVVDDLPPGGDSRAEYRGSEWTIRNIGESAILAGARAKVVKADSLTLHVIAE